MLAQEQKSILKSSRKYEKIHKSESCNLCFFCFENPLEKKISFEKNAKTYFYNDNAIFHKNSKHEVDFR
uniref:Uncharacterized protein n=1 Tax=viral metagenome TaxID=1070528 RepID=A0A6C0I0Z7_9ZZZZ